MTNTSYFYAWFTCYVSVIRNLSKSISKRTNSATKMRSKFEFPIYFMKDVFYKVTPIHMVKGLRTMRAKVMRCDCVIEVRDARVPLACANPDFEDLYIRKPRVILLNKIDLAHRNKTLEISKRFASQNIPVFLTDSKHFAKSARRILPALKDIFHKANTEEALQKGIEVADIKSRSYKVLLCGIPNVGKSSFINAARRHYMSIGGKATRVGKMPGVTRSVLNVINMCKSPKISILDTPGIAIPQISDPIIGIKLALTGTFADHVIGEEVIADYLLYVLNQQNNTMYIPLCGLVDPTDDFETLIEAIALKNNLFKFDGSPDYRECSILFVRMFRDGKLGPITLDT